MNMQEQRAVEHFARDRDLEESIDRTAALHNRDTESIKTFLDVLDDLVTNFNAKLESHDELRLHEYLRIKLHPHHHNTPPDYFDHAEIDYIDGFRAYIKYLEQKFHIRHGSAKEIFYNLERTMRDAIRENEADNKKLIAIINERLHQYSRLHWGIRCEGENLLVYLLHPKIMIYINRDWNDYSQTTSDFMVRIIVASTLESHIPDIVFNQGNVVSITFRNEHGYFYEIDFGNPIQGCIWKIRSAAKSLRNTESDNSEKLDECIDNCITQLSQLHMHYRNYTRLQGGLFLENIKTTRRIIDVAIDFLHRERSDKADRLANALLDISRILSRMWTNFTGVLNTNRHIQSSLTEIKRNDALYRLKNTETSLGNTFKEENLSAILASNLRCFYHYHSINVQCESLIGSGRSDIKIVNGNNTIAIVESKLVAGNTNIQKKIEDGLHQLFSRYSENDSLFGGSATELYLVIFSYDKKIDAIFRHVDDAVEKYSSERGIDCKKHQRGESHLHFSYVENREDFGFLNKQRTITIYLCNMEVDYRSNLRVTVRRKSDSH